MISFKQGNIINHEYLYVDFELQLVLCDRKVKCNKVYNNGPGFLWVVKEGVSEEVTMKLSIEGCIGFNQLKRGKDK